MDSRSHLITVTVSDRDLDDLGHVNNAVYLQWVESCCRAHADRLGMPTARMMELGAVPVVRRHEITYLRSARLGERLEVTTVITRVRGPLATRENEVRRAESGEQLVKVETDWVWIDPARGRPRAPSREVMAAFGFASLGD